MCKAYLESPVWAWGKRSLVMQGQSGEFWSSFQSGCGCVWVCVCGCGGGGRGCVWWVLMCIMFNRVFIWSSFCRMHYGRNITERFINKYFVTTVPCKVKIVAAVKEFWVTGSVLNQNKMEGIMFFLKRRWMIWLLSVNQPQKSFVPVGCLSKVSARECNKISET
jgi:hypothetical protein